MSAIRPILADGQEYYVAYVHRTSFDTFRAMSAYEDARWAALDEGKNWRRAKREGRRAEIAERKRLASERARNGRL